MTTDDSAGKSVNMCLPPDSRQLDLRDKNTVANLALILVTTIFCLVMVTVGDILKKYVLND